MIWYGSKCLRSSDWLMRSELGYLALSLISGLNDVAVTLIQCSPIKIVLICSHILIWYTMNARHRTDTSTAADRHLLVLRIPAACYIECYI